MCHVCVSYFERRTAHNVHCLRTLLAETPARRGAFLAPKGDPLSRFHMLTACRVPLSIICARASFKRVDHVENASIQLIQRIQHATTHCAVRVIIVFTHECILSRDARPSNYATRLLQPQNLLYTTATARLLCSHSPAVEPERKVINGHEFKCVPRYNCSRTVPLDSGLVIACHSNGATLVNVHAQFTSANVHVRAVAAFCALRFLSQQLRLSLVLWRLCS